MATILIEILWLTVVSVMFSTGTGKVLKSADKTCLSKACNETAEAILSKIDDSVSPCTDFYQYSCGEFLKRPIPSNRHEMSTYKDVEMKTEHLILRSLNRSDSKGPAIAKTLVKKFMDICTSNDHSSHRSKQPLLDDLEKLGGFPMLKESWNESRFDLTDVISKTMKIGFGSDALLTLFYFKDGLDIVLQISDPYIGIDRHNLLHHLKYRNDTHVEAYSNLISGTLKLLGADDSTLKCDIRDLLELTMSLAQVLTTPAEKVKFAVAKTIPVRDLYNYDTTINWTQLLKNTFGAEYVTEDTLIKVVAIKVLRRLPVLFQKFEKRTLANYLLWSVTFQALRYMDEPFLALLDDFYLVVKGQKERLSLEKSCQSRISGRLYTAVSSMYVADNFRNEIIQQIEPLKQSINNVFYSSLNNATWLDTKTKETALRKLRNTIFIFGYPKEILNETIMKSYLAPIKSTDSLYEFKKQLLALEITKYARNLKFPLDRLDWRIYAPFATYTNALYFLAERVIFMPCGYLYKEYFSADQPQYKNYGALGSTFGQAVVNSIAEIGRSFDHTGKVTNWWSNHSIQNFNEMKKCMINQYNQYSFAKIKVNGEQTISTNMADNGGIRQAYLAYLKVMDDDKELPKLRNYSKQQLFWISAAQLDCAKYTLQITKRYMKTKNHAISKVKVNGMVSNQREFAADFKCLPLSPMNPEKICKFV